MDRRDSLRSIILGSLAGTALLNSCAPEEQAGQNIEAPAAASGYGRTEKEKERDEKLMRETFFTEDELASLAVLCDVILPAEGEHGSASDAGVPEFIEFMSKDIPELQLPLRGGLMDLNHRAYKAYNQEFKGCTPEQQTALLDEIAYHDPEIPLQKQERGVIFFSLMRDLTLTGYYTTKMGIKALGYDGNYPNVWDGVPEDVLQKHGLAYDDEWLAKCVDQEKREEIAQWDEEGNLIS